MFKMNYQPNQENQDPDYATLWNSLQLAKSGIDDSLSLGIVYYFTSQIPD